LSLCHSFPTRRSSDLFGTSILAASCTLAVMSLPVVIVATRESLQAVPHAFREACWNMGATRWQTIYRVVLPNSISGILTGVILRSEEHTSELQSRENL